MITSFILLLAGILLKYVPPKKINALYGYRTGKSMKNDETWKFANAYAAMWLIRINAFLFMVSIFLYSWPMDIKNIESYLVIPAVAGLAVVIYRTEKYLSILFDDKGMRKTNR